jgi:hypothetical protein
MCKETARYILGFIVIGFVAFYFDPVVAAMLWTTAGAMILSAAL